MGRERVREMLRGIVLSESGAGIEPAKVTGSPRCNHQQWLGACRRDRLCATGPGRTCKHASILSVVSIKKTERTQMRVCCFVNEVPSSHDCHRVGDNRKQLQAFFIRGTVWERYLMLCKGSWFWLQCLGSNGDKVVFFIISCLHLFSNR